MARRRKKTTRKKASRKVLGARRSAGTGNQTGGSSFGRKPYPQVALEEALKVPQSIKDHNNGHPWETAQVAKATMNVKPSNTKFFYLAAASRDYGLTLGSRDTAQIAISDLGRRIVLAGDDNERKQGLLDAFFNVDVFSKVYKYYSGSANLPSNPEFLSNTLQKEFDLPREWHDDFVSIFKKNCEFLEIQEGLGARRERERPGDVEAAAQADVRVVGEPKGKFDRTAFVIMPFGEKGEKPRPVGYFGEVLTGLITPAANAAGFAVETANQHGSDVIQSTIINKLLAADLVIADLTDHNPNVLFELGVRLAKELPVALIKAEGTGPIFDVDNMLRVSKYDQNLWSSTIKTDIPKLTDHIKASWDNAETAETYMAILTRHSTAVGNGKSV